MDIREGLAENCHRQWAGWMEYLFSKLSTFEIITKYTHNAVEGGHYNEENIQKVSHIIPVWAYQRWQRQLNTSYKDLSEGEKDSDRKEADNVIIIVKEFLQERLKNAKEDLEAYEDTDEQECGQLEGAVFELENIINILDGKEEEDYDN